jgi:hypothetical protein
VETRLRHWNSPAPPRIIPRLSLPRRNGHVMDDNVETSVAPASIERAMDIFEKFKDRERTELVQARKGADRSYLRPSGRRSERRAETSRFRAHAPEVAQDDGASPEAMKTGSRSEAVSTLSWPPAAAKSP